MDCKEENSDNISIIENSKGFFSSFERAELLFLVSELNRRHELNEKRKNNDALQDVPESSEE